VRGRRIWKTLLGFGRAVIEDAFIEQETLVVNSTFGVFEV